MPAIGGNTNERRPGGRTASRRGLLIALALACWIGVAAENGADDVDSGWAVSSPTTTLSEPSRPDHETQILLQHIWEQSRGRFLRERAAATPPTAPAERPRVAERPPAATQWRSPTIRIVAPQSPPGQQATVAPTSPLQPAAPPAATEPTPHGGPHEPQLPLLQAPAAQSHALNAPQPAVPAEDSAQGEQPAESEPQSAPIGSTLLFSAPKNVVTNDTTADGEFAESESEAAINGAAEFADDEFGCEGNTGAADSPEDISTDSTIADGAIAAGEAELLDEAEELVDDESSDAGEPEDFTSQAVDGDSHDEEVDAGTNGPIGLDAVESETAPALESTPSNTGRAPAAEFSAGPPLDAQDVAPPAPQPPPPLTRQLVNLRSRVRSVLKGYYRKPLNSKEHDCWEAMHGMLAYGIHSRILQGSSRGTPITAVGWLCYNKPCKGLTLMYVTPQGELRAKWGVGLQGHSGQFLAMLAQCRVSPDYPIHVGKKEFTIRDLIEAEKRTCYPKSELTFKLIALQHYLDLGDTWVNDQGLEWSIPRLIREELAQPIRGAACGGTHRLSGLSLVTKARVRRGEPLDGEYARAAEFIQKYHNYAFRLQNRDGSLSTEWFRGRGDDDDLDRRIKTTGHILEWLCYSLSDQELRDQRTIRAVTYLANLMYSNYDHEWEVGPRSHAIHALVLYDERVFQPFDNGEVAGYKSRPSTANRSQQQQPRSRSRR